MKHNNVLFSRLVCVISGILLLTAGCEKGCEDIYKKAMSFYRTGQYEKASELFEILLTEFPDHSLSRKAHYQLADLYFHKLNQPPKALEHLQALYVNSPKGKYSMKALQFIGEIYDKSLNQCEKSIEAYRQLIRDYADELDASQYQFAIAECYFRLGDYEQAAIEYARVAENYPDSEKTAHAQFQTANSYALREAYEKAIALYETLLNAEALPAQLRADTKLELAYCYKQQEQYSKALALYEDLLSLDTSNVLLDSELIMRKKERVLKRIAESTRQPDKVQW
jgi:tetratricopeptide (TPR) repeat protein